MDVTDILKGFPNTGHDVRVDARGKGGGRAVGREGELAHDKGYYHSYLEEALVTTTPDHSPSPGSPPQNTRQGDGLARHRATWGRPT